MPFTRRTSRLASKKRGPFQTGQRAVLVGPSGIGIGVTVRYREDHPDDREPEALYSIVSDTGAIRDYVPASRLVAVRASPRARAHPRRLR